MGIDLGVALWCDVGKMIEPPARLRELNFTSMFVAFMQGAALEVIAKEFEVPLSTVQDMSRQQRWPALAVKAAEVAVPQLEDDESMAAIATDRKNHLQQARHLRDELNGSIALHSADGCIPIHASILKELIQAAQGVHDLVYRANGDKDKQQHPGQGSAPMTQININMPAELQQPRISNVIELPTSPPVS